jgi:L-histidine N-alpha-methyltransferase
VTATGPAILEERRDLEVLLTPDDLQAELLVDARRGLTNSARWLPPKYFYDDLGSRLFEQITRLPEYYPTRTEAAILRQHAGEIAHCANTEVLLELGSGASEKTRTLLDAMAAPER